MQLQDIGTKMSLFQIVPDVERTILPNDAESLDLAVRKKQIKWDINRGTEKQTKIQDDNPLSCIQKSMYLYLDLDQLEM